MTAAPSVRADRGSLEVAPACRDPVVTALRIEFGNGHELSCAPENYRAAQSCDLLACLLAPRSPTQPSQQ